MGYDPSKAGGKYRGAVPPVGANWWCSLAFNGTQGNLHQLLQTPIADQNWPIFLVFYRLLHPGL